jgi:hypothetical protein
MMRWLVLCATVVTLAGACGDSGRSAPSAASTVSATAVEPEQATFVLEFDNGKLVGGFRREEVGLGDPVRVLIIGELTERIHLHGYDVFVEPTSSDVFLEFDALIPGRFEIELEESSELLVQLTVS